VVTNRRIAVNGAVEFSSLCGLVDPVLLRFSSPRTLLAVDPFSPVPLELLADGHVSTRSLGPLTEYDAPAIGTDHFRVATRRSHLSNLKAVSGSVRPHRKYTSSKPSMSPCRPSDLVSVSVCSDWHRLHERIKKGLRPRPYLCSESFLRNYC
jgi:hypothetical protein